MSGSLMDEGYRRDARTRGVGSGGLTAWRKRIKVASLTNSATREDGMRARWQLGLLAVVAVVAAVWPVVGAAPLPLAAAYITQAECTKTAASGNWSNPATWTPSGVPGSSDIVCIPDGVTLVFDVTTSATVVGIFSVAGGTLDLNNVGTGTLFLSGGASADKVSTIGHLVGAIGTLNAAKTGTLPTIIRFLDSCRIDGPGDYVVTDGGTGGSCFLSGTGSPAPLLTLAVNMTPTGPWVLSGRRLVIQVGTTLTVKAWGMTLQSNAAVENHGIVNFAPGATDPDPDWTALAPINSTVENAVGGVITKTTAGATGIQRIAAPVINDGVITNSSPGALVVGGANVLSSAPGAVVIGGPVSGSGIFNDGVVHDDGALAPGHPLGLMVVNGPYAIQGGLNPTLAIELGGNVIGQFDSLNVNGTCSLTGTLSVTLVNGYTPQLGDTITIVECATGRFGTFAFEVLPTLPAPLKYDVVYLPNTVRLEVVSVTAVTFRSLTATRTRAGVRVRWRTAAESDTLGFNVYRGKQTARHRLNPHLIVSRGETAGSAYSFLDRKAPGGAPRYWLEVVGTGGVRTWQGAVRPHRR